jgi:hypothetical protein
MKYGRMTGWKGCGRKSPVLSEGTVSAQRETITKVTDRIVGA